MEPATAALALKFIQGASAVIGAVGAIQQANTAGDNYDNQAAASRYNAVVDEQQASSARAESSAAQIAHRRKVRQMLGTQRAGIAQSGIGGGSNDDLLDQTQVYSELDALNIAYEGQMKARGYQSQATLNNYYSGVYSANAGTARKSGLFGAAKSLLSGGSSLFSK